MRIPVVSLHRTLLSRLFIFVAISCAASAPAQAPASPDIAADVSQLDSVRAFAQKGEALARAWYPQIVKVLGGEPANPPQRIRIIMDLKADGVAGTSGDTIRVSARYVYAHPGDLGMIVHELTHVVQGYPQYDPVWLVEGIADYVRFYQYEPISKRPHPDPAKATYHDSYRTTACFLDYVAGRYDRDLIHKLDRALKTTMYSPDLFKQATGKDLDALNAEWIASLPPKPDRTRDSARRHNRRRAENSSSVARRLRNGR